MSKKRTHKVWVVKGPYANNVPKRKDYDTYRYTFTTLEAKRAFLLGLQVSDSRFSIGIFESRKAAVKYGVSEASRLPSD